VQFKFKVALKAINEIANTYDVHPTQIKSWKKQLLIEGSTVSGQNTVITWPNQPSEESVVRMIPK